MEWLVRFLVSGRDVYSSGNSCDSLNPDCAIAAFWKNGNQTELSFPEVTFTLAEPSSTATAVYWRNGLAVPLTDGTTRAAANQITVSGCDVYVGGAAWNSQGAFARYLPRRKVAGTC